MPSSEAADLAEAATPAPCNWAPLEETHPHVLTGAEHVLHVILRPATGQQLEAHWKCRQQTCGGKGIPQDI